MEIFYLGLGSTRTDWVNGPSVMPAGCTAAEGLRCRPYVWQWTGEKLIEGINRLLISALYEGAGASCVSAEVAVRVCWGGAPRFHCM